MATKSAASDANFSDWSEQPKEKRDLKKMFLVAGLALLSWVATYIGMLELVEANMGELPLVHKIVIGGSVAMLMTMIVWLLDQLFQPISLFTKLCYLFGYVFLSVISVGFGFGFYWKVLESKGEGTRVAETAVSSVQAPLQTAATRLESLGRTLDSLQTISAQKSEQERTAGTSCPNSRPGDGPRRKLREDDAARFAFSRDFVKARIDAVKTDIVAIEGEFAKIASNDASIVDKHGTRNEFMKNLNRRLDQTVTNFNAFKGDPQLKTIRGDLNDRAGKSQFVDTQGKPYSCPDPGLASMIRSVVASIDALPQLDKPKIATVEGSDATIEAFRRLTATFIGALTFKLPPSAEEMRDLQKRAVASAESAPDKRAAALANAEQAGLSRRDYIPLAVAIFVDLCLLLVSMGRPTNRLGNLVPKMQAAERGPVIQILSRFNEIHKDQQVRANFEIFRHVVFDLNGDYYVAVPLDAPPRMNPKDREELRLEAQLLANLFTSFEQEKIFSRVLMPYISVKQIQKKLWKQGSKFAHAETFRLYKFKDGAWSEIILGAIMGAARRVEEQKRVRRVEEEVFSRHEPSFAGPVSQRAMDLNQAMQAVSTHEQARAAAVTPSSRPVPPPPPFVHRPVAPGGYGAAAMVQPERAPAAVVAAHAAAFGPYAAAAAQASEQTSPMVDRPTHEVVADLNAHRQRLEAQAEVSVRPANNNTGPALGQVVVERAEAVTGALEPAAVVTATSYQPTDGVRVEAVERRMTFHMPAFDATVPPSLQAFLPQIDKAAEPVVKAPLAIEQTADAVEVQDDDASAFVPTVALPRDDDDATWMASRLAPKTTRS